MGLWVGWIGMALIVVGTYVPSIECSKVLFLCGTVTLGIAAILGKSRFYLVLQLPIILGASLALVSDGSMANQAGIVSVVFVAAVSAVWYLGSKQELVDWQAKVGAIGLVLLAFAFSSGVKKWLLPAQLFLFYNALYRYRVKRERVAIVWVVLEILTIIGSGISFFQTSS